MMKYKLLSLMVILSSLTGCITASTLPDSQRPQHWSKAIRKDQNFYQVSPFLFRSEQPNPQLLAELSKYQIDVVINLRDNNPDLSLFKKSSLELVHLPIKTWAINRTDLVQVMQKIKVAQQKNQKILIHCYHGSDRTGASIAMYRIIFEHWETQDALKEMKHGGYGFHPIWINIEKLFRPENIKWIQEQLSNPS